MDPSIYDVRYSLSLGKVLYLGATLYVNRVGIRASTRLRHKSFRAFRCNDDGMK